MQRASFTVRKKNGISYDANHLTIARGYDPDLGPGSISLLTFVCSGVQTTFQASEIESVTFHPASAQHCSECDGSIHGWVGEGIHANPVIPEIAPGVEVTVEVT